MREQIYDGTPAEQRDAQLNDMQYDAARSLPKGEGRSMLGDALTLFDNAAAAVITEWNDVEQNWSRLEVGAADERRRSSLAAFEDRMATAAALCEAAGRVIVADTLERALPPAPRSGSAEAMELRQELMMITDGLTGGKLAAALATIVKSSRRDLAGLVVSEWGDNFLASRGVRPTVKGSLVALAVKGSAEFGAGEVRAAAIEYPKLAKSVVQAWLPRQHAAKTKVAEVTLPSRRRQASLNHLADRGIDTSGRRGV